MASGEPVEVTLTMGTPNRLSRLAFHAQQFGYEYADIWQTGGTQGAFVMLLVPDPSPQARARAAQNRALYPDAADGGARSRPSSLKRSTCSRARLSRELTTRHSPLQLTMITAFSGLVMAAGAMEGCMKLGTDLTGFKDPVGRLVASDLGPLIDVGRESLVADPDLARFTVARRRRQSMNRF